MMTYIIWNVEPSIFPELFFLRWYSLCWAVGMLIGYRILVSIYKSEKQPQLELDHLTTYVILGTIIGARLGHILFYDPIYYWNNPMALLPFRLEPSFQFTGFAGLASHGGIIGVLLALFLFSKKFNKSYTWLLDRLMIAGAAVGAFIRLGNLMNSEIIGTPTNLPWAFVFARVDQIPRHPTQLYEAFCYLGLSVMLYTIWKIRKSRLPQGFIFGLGISILFTLRFLIEFIKENQVAFEEQLLINMGQTLSIPLVLAGIFIMLWSLNNTSKGSIFSSPS